MDRFLINQQSKRSEYLSIYFHVYILAYLYSLLRFSHDVVRQCLQLIRLDEYVFHSADLIR